MSKSYGDHFLVVGDAAGQTDPLTGGINLFRGAKFKSPSFQLTLPLPRTCAVCVTAGIHYAMEAAKMAAETLIEGLNEGDLSERQMSKYHKRWKAAFGWDYWL